MRASPRRSQIAPVGTVPVPVFIAGNLAEGGAGDGSSSQAERTVLHAQRLKYFLAEEFPQRRVANTLNNFGGQQYTHALIPALRAGLEQQRRLAGTGHEIFQWRMAFAQGFVLRKHVRQTGGVGQKMLDSYRI